MAEQGVLVIISGPSGAGKGTVVTRLLAKEEYELSISVTTRKPRAYEIEGKHYFFRSESLFHEMIQNKELLEYAEFCGNYYGTPKQYVEEMLNAGKNVILEIEVQGALKVQSQCGELNPILIFMLPPTIQELQNRLKNRGTENEEAICKRIRRAKEELLEVEHYDYIVINQEVDQSVLDIQAIVAAEKMSVERNQQIVHKFLS